MAVVSKELKLQIASLPKEDLAKLVLKAASKDKVFLDYILLTHFKGEYNDEEVFESYELKINALLSKRFKGYVEELKAANYIADCNKLIADFEKSSKNKEYLANLILLVLDNAFEFFEGSCGTCFTAFDHKVYLLLKKIIKVVMTQMHEDMQIEYKGKINGYLKQIWKSDHLDYVHNLPKEI